MSQKNSLEGWDYIEWIKGNWSAIKEVVKVGIPLILALKFVSSNPALVLGVTALGKLILDIGHYYVKKQ